ncbi:MAG: hypothetical protein JST54_19155 [Deltaproteobacteria bacterium]|nr:hypothetical protein [Deltaproteobacteria bacterium]
MRRLGPLALALTTLACAREVGTRVPRALAGSDAHAWPNRPATFTGTCEGCTGNPKFQWSFASGDDPTRCTLDDGDSATPSIRCTEPGLWVLRFDVRDSNGQGTPDYANLLVSNPPAASSGSTGGSSSTSTTSTSGSTGSVSTSTASSSSTTGTTGSTASTSSTGSTGTSTSTGSTSSTGTSGTTGGVLTGTLVALRPDGSAATDVLVGDLIELHATPSDPSATCTFDPILVDAQTLTTTVPCTAAVVLKAPVVTTFGVTFNRGAQTALASSGPVTAHGPELLNATTAIRTLAADPISGWALATRSLHSAIVFDPTTQTLDYVTNHTGGLASAGGTVLDLAWSFGNIGRYYEDGTVDETGTNAGAFTSVATAASADANNYLPVLVATDGSMLVGWSENETENEDSSVRSDLLADVKDPANPGLSAGVMLVSDSGNQVSFLTWGAVHDFALNGSSLTPASVTVSVNHIVNATSSSRNGGTVWLADSGGHVYEFTQAVGSGRLTLGSPALNLATAGTIDAIALDVDGPYGDDLWVVGNNAFQRVVASPNTVGAQPTVVTLDLLLTADAVAVGNSSAGRAVYFGADEGLFWATF